MADDLHILSEPLTYYARLVPTPDRRGGHKGFRAISDQNYSYAQDLTKYTRKLSGAQEAGERLQRHDREMRAIEENRSICAAPGVRYWNADGTEQRAVSWTSGQGGYFAPPAWLVEYFATVPTSPRVFAAQMPTFDLPGGVQSINIPRLLAGADLHEAQINSPVSAGDVTDAAAESAVATIAGNEDVPLQMLEQSPQGAHFDWLVFSNMEERYDYKLELQLMTGRGAATPQGSGNNELLGILNNTAIPSSNIITYTPSGSPEVQEMIQASDTSPTQGGVLPQAIANIGNNRKRKPEMWMMSTSRAAWVVSATLEFPIALDNQPDPGVFDLLTYPVHPNDAIPRNLGSGFNQDVIILCRPSDWLLLEGERRTNVYVEALSGSLMARFQMRRYVAAILRQPTSVAYLQGTGLVIPSGF